MTWVRKLYSRHQKKAYDDMPEVQPVWSHDLNNWMPPEDLIDRTKWVVSYEQWEQINQDPYVVQLWQMAIAHGTAEARRSLRDRNPADYQLISSSAIQLNQGNMGNIMQASHIPVTHPARPDAQTPVLRAPDSATPLKLATLSNRGWHASCIQETTNFKDDPRIHEYLEQHNIVFATSEPEGKGGASLRE